MATTTATTMTLDALTARLRTALGDELTAVILYGSAARGEHVAQRSDFNVLVIVRALAASALRSLSPLVDEWRASGNPAPLILTEAEWQSSRDVFAIEVADILERHRALHGALPAVPGGVAMEDLRHQLEFEAMGKLLALRQGILAAGADQEREVALLLAARSAVLVLFRTLLRVQGEEASASSEEVVRRTAVRVGFDAAPFLEVLTHAAGGAAVAPARVDAVLAAWHAGLERFVAHVDGLAAR